MKKLTLSLVLLLSTIAVMAQDFSIPLEANGGYINFNDDSRFKDTWYVGGSTGFDFTDNAGIRGYYWKALDDGQIDEMDKLEIYGAESKVKIPISKYVKPYLVVGGGLLKPYGGYIGEDGLPVTQDQFFGSAGGGLDLNFIRFLSVTGYARAMVSDFNQLNDLGQEDTDISSSWNYGASINFNIGDNGFKKKTNSASQVVMPAAPKKDSDTVDVQEEMDKRLEQKASEEKVAELERRIEELEAEKKRSEEREKLKEELREELMNEYQFERRMNRKQLPEVDVQKEIEIIETTPIETTPQTEADKKKINKLTAQNDELEASIGELNTKINSLEAQAKERLETKKTQIADLENQIKALEEEKTKAAEASKIAELERSIESLNKEISTINTSTADLESDKELNDLRKEIKRLESERVIILSEKDKQYEIEMARMKQQLELQNQLRDLKNGREEAVENAELEVKLLDREFLSATQESLTRDEFHTLLQETEVGEGDTFGERLFYTHTNAFLAGGFGDDNYGEALIGIKPNFFFAGSKMRLAPEASIGFGDETSVNVLANALYNLNIESATVKPYLGGGAGFIMPNGDFKPAINIAFGSEFENIANGKLSAEFAGRNLFKYNQISVGYEIF